MPYLNEHSKRFASFFHVLRADERRQWRALPWLDSNQISPCISSNRRISSIVKRRNKIFRGVLRLSYPSISVTVSTAPSLAARFVTSFSIGLPFILFVEFMPVLIYCFLWMHPIARSAPVMTRCIAFYVQRSSATLAYRLINLDCMFGH